MGGGAGGGPRAADLRGTNNAQSIMNSRKWDLLARFGGADPRLLRILGIPEVGLMPGMQATAQRITGFGQPPASRTSNFGPYTVPAVAAAARGFLGPGPAAGSLPALAPAVGGGMGGAGDLSGIGWGGRNGGLIRRRY